jgi:tRNA pseudouridine55 synthase
MMVNNGRENRNGILLVDKEAGWKSFDVVKKIRYTLKVNKVGHGGALDRFAEGLMIIFYGKKATRLSQISLEEVKTYKAIVRLGVATDTDDPEGNIIKRFEGEIEIGKNVSEKDIMDVLSGFVGEIEQVPPLYSAKKIGGKRASDLVRAGEKVELMPKKVKIHYINYLGAMGKDSFAIEVRTSKGAYIRALARDIGEALGVYGYLYSLKRLQIGNWKLDSALKIDEIVGIFRKDKERFFEQFSLKNFFLTMKELYIKPTLIPIIIKNKKIPLSFIKNQNVVCEDILFYVLRNETTGKELFIVKYVPYDNILEVVSKC